MSRHNRRRRRNRQTRHHDLLADADAFGSDYESSNSVMFWPAPEISSAYPNNAYAGFSTPSLSTGSSSTTIANASYATQSSTDCRECTLGAECQSKASTGDYSFFWLPTPGQNPWAPQPSSKQPGVSDNYCEYLYARKKNFPSGLGKRLPGYSLPVSPWYKPLEQAAPILEKDEILLPHGEHCDSMCHRMTSVIKFLFKGKMDYDDEEIHLAQAKKKAEQRPDPEARRQAERQREAEQRDVAYVLDYKRRRTQQRHEAQMLRAQKLAPGMTSMSIRQNGHFQLAVS